jgi:hypothetical protein
LDASRGGGIVRGAKPLLELSGWMTTRGLRESGLLVASAKVAATAAFTLRRE